MVKAMTDEETREYHLNKFAQWGNKWEQEQKDELDFKVDGSVWRNGKPLLEEPTYEQKQWVLHKLKGSASTWSPCC